MIFPLVECVCNTSYAQSKGLKGYQSGAKSAGIIGMLIFAFS